MYIYMYIYIYVFILISIASRKRRVWWGERVYETERVGGNKGKTIEDKFEAPHLPRCVGIALYTHTGHVVQERSEVDHSRVSGITCCARPQSKSFHLNHFWNSEIQKSCLHYSRGMFCVYSKWKWFRCKFATPIAHCVCADYSHVCTYKYICTYIYICIYIYIYIYIFSPFFAVFTSKKNGGKSLSTFPPTQNTHL